MAANLLALEHGECGVFNVGRGVQVSDYEIFDAVRTAVGCSDEPAFAPFRSGEVQRIALDAKAAMDGLGWKAKAELPEGLAKTVAHIRSQIGSNMKIEAPMNLPSQPHAVKGETRDSL